MSECLPRSLHRDCGRESPRRACEFIDMRLPKHAGTVASRIPVCSHAHQHDHHTALTCLLYTSPSPRD
eukprot:11301679-Alexandrium_andersonii.AAC.1